VNSLFDIYSFTHTTDTNIKRTIFTEQEIYQKVGIYLAREVASYKLDLVGVQEDRRDKGGTVRAGGYNFPTENKTKIIN
jgi:hypothetical protein